MCVRCKGEKAERITFLHDFLGAPRTFGDYCILAYAKIEKSADYSYGMIHAWRQGLRKYLKVRGRQQKGNMATPINYTMYDLCMIHTCGAFILYPVLFLFYFCLKHQPIRT